jgi:outer membrane protein
MKKIFVACTMLFVTLIAGTAVADSIAGRIGVTGRLGFLVPADSDQVASGVVVETDAALIGGGGFIYGINKNFAVELDITHSEFDGDRVRGPEGGDFSTTNITLGVQYRFVNLPNKQLVPFVGGGLNILVNDFRFNSGERANVDTVVGVHLSGGVDYFIMKQLALTGEIKGLIAADADVRDFKGNGKIGNFDPSGISATAGVRYFFN